MNYQNHPYWDKQLKNVLFPCYMTTLPHCKSPHAQGKFKYLFIFLATMCYTCSQLQNCPVQTRLRHIQCRSFPSRPRDLCCYSMSAYFALSSSLDLLQRTVCFGWSARKKRPYNLPRIINRLRLKFMEGERAWCVRCDGVSVGWEKAQQKRDQVHATRRKKQLKQQSNTKWKIRKINRMNCCCVFIAPLTNL